MKTPFDRPSGGHVPLDQDTLDELASGSDKIAARPIRINRDQVDDLTRRIVDALRREGEGREQEPVGVREAILEEQFIGITVDGEPKTVLVVVTSGRGSNDPFVSGGGFGRVTGGPYKGAPIIIVEVDGRHSWHTFGQYEVVGKYLNNLLMHEITHAMDRIRRDEPAVSRGGYIPTTDDVDLGAYYNDPHEVRAYMRQLYEEIRPLVLGSMDKGSLREKWGLGGAVSRFLRVNYTWKRVSPYLTRENRNRILKGIVTAFEDDLPDVPMAPSRVASAWLSRTAWAGGACNPGALSTAWITPEGAVIPVPPGETHSTWANAHLADDPGFLDQGYGSARYLTDTLGWVRQVNAYTIETGPRGTTDRAMQVAVDTVIDCAVRRRDVDPEVDTVTIGVGSRTLRPTIAEFVAEYGTSGQVDAMYDRLMSRTAAARRPKYQGKKEVPKADGSGTTTVYQYGPRQVANRHKEKADRIEGLRGRIGDLRRRVKSDLKSDDPETRLTALAVALIDATYERVGNDESADNGHYGVTGWTMDHVTFSKNGKRATIRYIGKSGVEHEKIIDDPNLVGALKSCCEDKDKADHVLSEGDFRVKPAMVNEYLREFDITAKDLRGFHANREMQERLRTIRRDGPELPRPRKERDAILKEEFAEALEGAAEAVGHEPPTLRKQYLVPWLEDAYMKDGTVIDRLDKKASSGTVLYFAYGSNMDPVRMSHRTPNAVPVGTATLPDHKVVFTKLPEGVDGGKAAIVPSSGESVDGIVYRIPVSEMDHLDFVEGVPHGHYTRDSVIVHASNGRQVRVYTYKPSNRATVSEDPSDEYSIEVQHGLDQWGFAPRNATKTHAEREDEEAERLVRRSPKLKPSRDDSKRERVQIADPDTVRVDKDLSLNYKDNG